MTARLGAASEAAVVHGSRDLPYRAGWFDRLTDAIDRMPGPNCLYALVIAALQLAYLTVGLWAAGTVPTGTVNLRLAFFAVVTPYFLWVRFMLDRVAVTALERFGGALGVDPAEHGRLRYQLTTLPARLTNVVSAIAVTVFLVNVTFLPDAVVLQYGRNRAEAILVVAPISLLTFAVVAVAITQAIHQLRMVERVHELARGIDLWQGGPVYAFSALTARTGVSFLLVTYFVAVVRPDLVRQSPALEILLIAMVPTAIACFVLPLRGMHQRLTAEKDALLVASTGRLQAALQRLHQRVDEGQLGDADKVNQQLTSLVTERDALGRLSTWPWQASTVMGFGSAALPVVVWAVQRVLERAGF